MSSANERNLHLVRLANQISQAKKRGRLITTLELSRQFLQLDPQGSPYFSYVYADTLRILGRWPEAKALFLQLEKTDLPSARLGYLIQLAIAQGYELIEGDLSQAEVHLRRATEINPDTTITWIMLGEFLAHHGRIDEACDIYRRALNAKGDIDEVHLHLGHCQCSLGNYRAAILHYQKAIELDPDYTEAREAIADIQFAESLK